MFKMRQFVQSPCLCNCSFSFMCWKLRQKWEVMESAREEGIMGEKKDLCQQMKEPNFSCVSGEIELCRAYA